MVREIDLSANPRIAELTRVMRRVSGVADPAAMLAAFTPWMGARFRSDYLVTVSRRGMPPGQYKFTRVLPGADGGQPAEGRAGGSAPGPSFANPWLEWDRIPTHSGGLVGEIIARGEPRLMSGLDLAADPVLGGVMGAAAGRMRSLAAIPTYDDGEAINWSLSLRADEAWEDIAEFEERMLDISIMGAATRNLVARRQVEGLNARLSAQLEQIARIQRALLPERSPEIPGYEVATSYITSDESGGDYYDFYHYPDGRVGLLIADVSGHGAGAATVMAMLRAIIHCYESLEPDTAGFAQYCNTKLTASRLDGNFITAFFCILDPATGGLAWTRAGHNPPRVRRADGTVDVLTSAATLPLGIVDDLGAESDRGVLGPGDTLVLYTDGITELRDGATELFGEARLDAALHACNGRPECVVDSIHSAMYAFTGSMTRQDDQTLVVLRRDGANR